MRKRWEKTPLNEKQRMVIIHLLKSMVIVDEESRESMKGDKKSTRTANRHRALM